MTSMAMPDNRYSVMVAGKDPYPGRGTANIAKAFVRSSGEGGCEL